MKLEDLTKDELVWVIQARCLRTAADFECDILMRRNDAIEQAASAELTQALTSREEYAKLMNPYSGKALVNIPTSVIDEAPEQANASDAAMQIYGRLSKQSRSLQSRIDRILAKSESRQLSDAVVASGADKQTDSLGHDAPHYGQPKSTPEPALSSDAENRVESSTEAVPLWHGFVHIRCDHCHKETTTCLRTPTREYICRSCGHQMLLPNPTTAYINCECGFNGRYLTNISDWLFDIPCVCGIPNTVKYLPGKDIYVPVNQGPKRIKFKGRH